MTIRARRGPDGQIYLDPSPQIDPDVLKIYGALSRKDGWLYPARKSDIELLQGAGLQVDVPADLQEEWDRKDKMSKWLQKAKDVESARPDHPSWNKLDGHQKVGVTYLASRERALLAFSPGLGKSATAVVAAELLPGDLPLPILVVAPLTLIPTWKEEIGKWGEGRPVANLREDDWVEGWNIINPDLLGKRDFLKQVSWKVIVFDESVLYKSRSARRTKQARELAKGRPYVWMLSGSPVTRFADDLWGQLSVLRPEWFRSYWRFAERWTHIRPNAWGQQVVGNRDPEGLRWYLRDVMISRTPKEVPVLPDNPLDIIKVEPTKKQLKWLKEAKETFQVGDISMPNVVTQLTRMAQILSYPKTLGLDDKGAKIPAMKELMEYTPGPYLVWTWFQDSTEVVTAELRKMKMEVGMVHGGVGTKMREETLRDYTEGKLDALVLQIGTGKFGLSLTSTKTVVFYDRSFGLDDWVQASARVRRRSSTEPVPTYVLDAGWTDRLISVALKRKLRSVTDLGTSDLLEQLK